MQSVGWLTDLVYLSLWSKSSVVPICGRPTALLHSSVAVQFTARARLLLNVLYINLWFDIDFRGNLRFVCGKGFEVDAKKTGSCRNFQKHSVSLLAPIHSTSTKLFSPWSTESLFLFRPKLGKIAIFGQTAEIQHFRGKMFQPKQQFCPISAEIFRPCRYSVGHCF